MSKLRTLTYSFLGGVFITLSSLLFVVNNGDFISRGFPISYLQATWGMGYSWSFEWQIFLLDVIGWGFVSFVVAKLIFVLKKK